VGRSRRYSPVVGGGVVNTVLPFYKTKQKYGAAGLLNIKTYKFKKK